MAEVSLPAAKIPLKVNHMNLASCPWKRQNIDNRCQKISVTSRFPIKAVTIRPSSVHSQRPLKTDTKKTDNKQYRFYPNFVCNEDKPKKVLPNLDIFKIFAYITETLLTCLLLRITLHKNLAKPSSHLHKKSK